jgi:hypothetical protein
MTPDALKTIITNTGTSDRDKRTAITTLRKLAAGPISADRDRAINILRELEHLEPSEPEDVTFREFNAWLDRIDPARVKAMTAPFDPAWHFWRERGDDAAFRLWRVSGIESTIEGFRDYINGGRSPISAEMFPLLYGQDLSRESASRAVKYLETRLANLRRGRYE